MEFPWAQEKVPSVTTGQMIQVDRLMIERYHIELVQMMENAGRNLAHLARSRFLDGDPRGRHVTVLAGPGGNGGGALVCARRLANYGARVEAYLTRPGDVLAPVPAHQLDILHRLQVPVGGPAELTAAAPPELIVDGVVGYSLKGAPRGAAADFIRWANEQPAPILSLDTPSGLEAGTGTVFDPAVRATATMTLALPKTGLLAPGVEVCVGELYLADISVPPALYADASLDLAVGYIFARGDIIRLR